MKPLPNKYFENYADNGIPYGQHKTGFFYGAREYLNPIEQLLSKFQIHSVFDVGAATGFLLKQFQQEGISLIRGVESSPWCKKRCLPEFKNLITFKDWFTIAPTIPDNFYDLVIDTACIYYPPEKVHEGIYHSIRIAKKAVGFCAEGCFEDPWRTITKPKHWWGQMILECPLPKVQVVDIRGPHIAILNKV